MTEVVITVQGEHSAWFPAERASVTVTAQFDGPDRNTVFQQATDAAAHVRLTVELLSDSAVTWWSADSVRVWSERPWNQDGKQLDPVFTASVGIQAKFRDFDALATWVEDIAATDGVTISGITWQLTEATRASVTAEVRSRAVKNAVTKATVFAQSIGLATVTATAISDPGMLGDANSLGGGSSARAFKSELAMDSSGALAFKPEQIEVAAAVDARFVAS